MRHHPLARTALYPVCWCSIVLELRTVGGTNLCYQECLGLKDDHYHLHFLTWQCIRFSLTWLLTIQMGHGTQNNGINSLMIPRNLKWLTKTVTRYESSNILNYPFATLYNPNIWHSTSYHESQRMGTFQNILQKQSLQSFMTKQVTCVT